VRLSINAILGFMDPRRPQRFTIVAAGLCFSLLQAAGGIAAQPAAAPAAPASAANSPIAGAAAGEAAAGDAAAKHARRTACLKDAKAKKLVGAEKNAFVKNCIAVP
jgi:hypothetical protein